MCFRKEARGLRSPGYLIFDLKLRISLGELARLPMNFAKVSPSLKITLARQIHIHLCSRIFQQSFFNFWRIYLAGCQATSSINSAVSYVKRTGRYAGSRSSSPLGAGGRT